MRIDLLPNPAKSSRSADCRNRVDGNVTKAWRKSGECSTLHPHGGEQRQCHSGRLPESATVFAILEP
jgi:hypothetical protein